MQFFNGKMVRFSAALQRSLVITVLCFSGKTYFFKNKGFWKFNDLHMRVEKAEQTASAPFWMGCERNIKEYEQVRKAPYTDLTSSTNDLRPSFLINVLLLFGALLKMNALIT